MAAVGGLGEKIGKGGTPPELSGTGGHAYSACEGPAYFFGNRRPAFLVRQLRGCRKSSNYWTHHRAERIIAQKPPSIRGINGCTPPLQRPCAVHMPLIAAHRKTSVFGSKRTKRRVVTQFENGRG